MENPANGLKNSPSTTEGSAQRSLDLSALQQTPGFMIRILQLEIFERFYPHFETLGISPADYAILVTVRDNKTVTQSELAAVLRIKLPNLVKILSKMEGEGVLKRKRSSRDKRAVELSLTSAGRKRADAAKRLDEAFNAKVLAALGKQERTVFLEMLARLVGALEYAA